MIRWTYSQTSKHRTRVHAADRAAVAAARTQTHTRAVRALSAHVLAMDCAICLSQISPSQEAYLHPCFHFFCRRCIQGWTDRQRQHAADEACPAGHRCAFTCPLCKQPYAYIVYDIVGTSYRLLPMCGQPQTMSAMPLTADQRRRRARYVTPRQQQQLAPAAQQARRAARARPPSDAQTSAWLQRELQAVLLAEDVDVIVQHTLGVLHSLAGQRGGARRPQAAAPEQHSAVYGPAQDFHVRLHTAMAPFLAEHSPQFASELWAFLHSGLGIPAYDRLVFGQREPSASSAVDDGDDDPASLPQAAADAADAEEDEQQHRHATQW